LIKELGLGALSKMKRKEYNLKIEDSDYSFEMTKP
jgi:hypothetical protein